MALISHPAAVMGVPHNRPLHLFAMIIGWATLGLIFVGGMVTSTDSGLSVPDWPNTYGRFMFAFPLSDMVGGIFYEHSHRMIASLVGMLMVILAIWLWRTEERGWVRKLGWIALAAVVAQGLLGGITVLYLLPTAVSVFHAVLAQTFFLLVIALGYVTSQEFTSSAQGERVITSAVNIRRWVTLTTGLIFLQLLLGALMRHTGAGLAYFDFPLAGGRYWSAFSADLIEEINRRRWELELPSVTRGQLLIHFAHRLGALGVVLAVVTTTVKIWRNRELARSLRPMAGGMVMLLVGQIALGALTVLSLKQALITTTHVATGAALLGLSFLATLRVYHFYPLSQGLNRATVPAQA